MDRSLCRRIFLLILFGAAMGYFEASVVVYIREIYFPEGFSFPLPPVPMPMAVIEIGREAASIIMLVAFAGLAGTRLWERFGYFIAAFGIWDIFYYIWLKAAIGWPSSLFEPHILFLIPVPWTGPVIAPALVSILLTGFGIAILSRSARGVEIRFPMISPIFGASGILIIFYTFVFDYHQVIRQRPPEPYPYAIFGIGFMLLLFACRVSLWGGSRRDGA